MQAAPRPCTYPGCPALVPAVRGGRCEIHAKLVRRENEKHRRGHRLYDRRWQRERDRYLREHPLCVTCTNVGRVVPATEIDHKVPHCGDLVLFWDKSNWQSMCHTCHSSKTAREDGGFGHEGGRG